MPSSDPDHLPDRGRPANEGPAVAAVLAAMAPAYVFPAAVTFANSLVIPDEAVAARLQTAAWSTIAIPSALAAGLVTLWLRHRRPPAPGRWAGLRAFTPAALACAALASAGTAVLIRAGVLDLAALQFTVSSAALGGGLAARRRARAHGSGPRRRRRRPGSPADSDAGPGARVPDVLTRPAGPAGDPRPAA